MGDREFGYRLAFKLFNYARSVLFIKILNAFVLLMEEYNFYSMYILLYIKLYINLKKIGIFIFCSFCFLLIQRWGRFLTSSLLLVILITKYFHGDHDDEMCLEGLSSDMYGSKNLEMVSASNQFEQQKSFLKLRCRFFCMGMMVICILWDERLYAY